MKVTPVVLALVVLLAGLTSMTAISSADNCPTLAGNHDKFQCCDAGIGSSRCIGIERAYGASGCGELQCVVTPDAY